MEFSKKLILLRKQYGYLQEELARMLGISKRTLQLYESGQRYPKKAVLDQICSIFSISMKELLETEPAAETVPTAAPIQLEHLTARQLVQVTTALVQAARAFYQREDLTELEREQVMYAVQHFFWDAKKRSSRFFDQLDE